MFLSTMKAGLQPEEGNIQIGREKQTRQHLENEESGLLEVGNFRSEESQDSVL